MREPSETSLILKMEMKQLEPEKNLPRNSGFQRRGKKLNTSNAFHSVAPFSDHCHQVQPG